LSQRNLPGIQYRQGLQPGDPAVMFRTERRGRFPLFTVEHAHRRFGLDLKPGGAKIL
jgi:hypothetical protein